MASSGNLETGGRGSKHTLINFSFSFQVWVRSAKDSTPVKLTNICQFKQVGVNAGKCKKKREFVLLITYLLPSLSLFQRHPRAGARSQKHFFGTSGLIFGPLPWIRHCYCYSERNTSILVLLQAFMKKGIMIRWTNLET